MILFLKSTLTISIRAICVVIFAWHFYLLTQNYQEFNVRKEVTHYIPNEIEFPEIHILIPYQLALDPGILRTKYKSQFDDICTRLSDEKDCDGNITNPVWFSLFIGPHLLLTHIVNYSYPPETFMKRLYVPGVTEDPLKTGDCKLTSRVSSSFFVLVLKCFDSSGSPKKIPRAKAVVYSKKYLFGFVLNTTTVSFNLIHSGKAALEDESLYTFSSATAGKQITHLIRFTKHTENLLPSPYKTMCKNYNRRQTFEDCLNVHSIEQTGMLFPGTTVLTEKYSKASKMHFNAISFNDNGTLFKIYEQCQSLVAQPMCSSVQYTFKVSSTIEEVPKGYESLALHFMVSSEPDSITESRADFPLFDYLILSGSLISSWFGISIMGQLLVASNFFCLAVKRKKAVDSVAQNEESESQ